MHYKHKKPQFSTAVFVLCNAAHAHNRIERKDKYEDETLSVHNCLFCFLIEDMDSVRIDSYLDLILRSCS